MAVKLNIKTLREHFQVDIDPSQTVARLKEEIFSSKGYAVERQKLVYSAKVLEDSENIGAIGSKETDYLVLLLSRLNATSDPSTEAPSALNDLAKGKGKAKEQDMTHTDDRSESPFGGDVINLVSPQLSGFSPSSLNTGNSWKEASYSNNAPSFSTSWQPPVGPSSSQYGNFSEMPTSGDLSDTGSLADMIRNDPATRQAFIDMASQSHPELGEFLKKNPQMLDSFLTTMVAREGEEGNHTVDVEMLNVEEKEAVQQIMAFGFSERKAAEAYIVADKNMERAVNYLLNAHDSDNADSRPESFTSQTLNEEEILKDPAFKQRLLERIQQDNPQLARQIEENPELFNMALENAGPVVNAIKICLTREEWKAVDRLVEMGFTKANAAQAYIACDKDEEKAANFLLSNPENDDAEEDENDVEANKAAPIRKEVEDQDMDYDPAKSAVLAGDIGNTFNLMDVKTGLGEGSSRPTIVGSTAILESDEAQSLQVDNRIPSPSRRESRVAGVIELSTQDGEVIQSLMDCGFTEHQAVEAYLVSDKDQRKALNYLLDQQ